MRPLMTLLVLFALLCLSTALAQDAAELEVDHSVSSDFVTPHTAWAKPYAQGKARVLFFLRGHGTAPREVIELKQRFDLEPQMVFWARVVDSDVEGWHGAENGIRRMERLLSQKWDAYVFLGVSPEKLPVEQQYKLVKAVTDGAGLVLVGVDDKRLLKDDNAIKPVPAALANGPVGEPFTVQQGRGISLPSQPNIEYRPGWETDYDYWQQRLGRAVLWAAGKQPAVNLHLSMPKTTLDRSEANQNPLTVAISEQEAPAGLSVSVALRRDDGWTKEFPAPEGVLVRGLKLNWSAVPAGNYHWDVIARGKNGVEDFASLPFTVASVRRVTGIALDRKWGEVGDTLSGQVALAGGDAVADERLVIALRDRFGRELARQVTPIGAAMPFSFKLEPWLPMLVTVQATVFQGDREIASNWTFANVIKRNRGRFNFLIWDTPTGTLAPYGEEMLARTGTTAQLRGGTPAPWVAAFDIAWVPYTTRILTPKDENGIMQPACWNDEPMIQAHVDKIVKDYQGAREHGVFVYSLGDEGEVRGSCLSPYCLAAYRVYLQQEYGNIAALNTSWGSNYTSFDEVQLTNSKDNEEADALRAGNFPRWFDRQAFQSYNFCKLCERFGKGFASIDPQSKCGFEGAGTFGAADDLDGFVRGNTFWSPYPGTADEVVRSIAPRDFPRSNWMGYTKDANTLLEKYWRMVTRGCDSVWFWRWDCIGAFHGWLSPTLDPYPAVKEILKDTEIVRNGLGDLLLQTEMQDDGIGILYSQPSAYAAKIQNSTSFGGYEADHNAWHSAIRDLGMNFRYFTDRQMRLGEVDLSKLKVIILAMAQALGPQEVDALRQYVQNGGTLIADTRPGIYDGHLKPLAAGSLDDLFGVKRNGLVDATIADATVKFADLGEVTLPKAKVDGGIAAAVAQASGNAAEAPVFLVNSAGKGKTVLLNLAMSSLPSLAANDTPAAAADLIRAVLGTGGAKPAVQLTGASGRIRNVEVTRWSNGDTEIISIFRHMGQPEQAKLTLPRAMQVYDLKARKDLGKQQTLNLTITPYRAQWFVLSRAPLTPVGVSVDKATAAPGSVVQARLVGPAGSKQAAHVRVKGPDGKLVDWLDEVVVTDSKGATLPVPVAFNDGAGKYTVLATDLTTGRTTTCDFNVK